MSNRPLFQSLTQSLGCPEWIRIGASVYVRKGPTAPFDVRGPFRVARVVVVPWTMQGDVTGIEFAFVAVQIDHTSYDSGEYRDLGGHSTGSYTRNLSWTETVPVAWCFTTRVDARGGYPLAGDSVTCDLPEGVLTTKVVRVFESNGAPMIEVSGGRILPVGCVRQSADLGGSNAC